MFVKLTAAVLLSLCVVAMCGPSTGFFGKTNGAGSGVFQTVTPYVISDGSCTNKSHSGTNYIGYDVTFDSSNATMYMVVYSADSASLTDIFDFLVYNASEFNDTAPCQGVYNSLFGTGSIHGAYYAIVDFQPGTYKFVGYSSAGPPYNGNFAFNLTQMDSVCESNNSKAITNDPTKNCAAYNSSFAHEFTVAESGYYDIGCYDPMLDEYSHETINVYYSTNGSTFDSCNASLLTYGNDYLGNVSLTAGVHYSVVCSSNLAAGYSKTGLEVSFTRIVHLGTTTNYLSPINGQCNAQAGASVWEAQKFYNPFEYLLFAVSSYPNFSGVFLQFVISIYSGENLGNATTPPNSCGYSASGFSPSINGAAVNTEFTVIVAGLPEGENPTQPTPILLWMLGGTNINGATYNPTTATSTNSGQSTNSNSGQATTSQISGSNSGQSTNSNSGQSNGATSSNNQSSSASRTVIYGAFVLVLLVAFM